MIGGPALAAGRTEVHIRPLPTGFWAVQMGDRPEPASLHPTANEAERAARRLLANAARFEIVVHDLYHRRRRAFRR